jgi:hypothetical protein
MYEIMAMVGVLSSEENSSMRMPIEEMQRNRIVMVKNDVGFRRAKIECVDLEEKKVTIRDCDRWDWEVIPSKDVFYMVPSFMNLPFRVRNQLRIGCKDLDLDQVI